MTSVSQTDEDYYAYVLFISIGIPMECADTHCKMINEINGNQQIF